MPEHTQWRPLQAPPAPEPAMLDPRAGGRRHPPRQPRLKRKLAPLLAAVVAFLTKLK